MKIKLEYRKKTREYITNLVNKKNSIDLIEKEIKDLKNQEKYQEIDFESLGFKGKGDYKDLSDLVIYLNEQVFIKEAEIDHINNKYSDLELFLSKLKESERKVIEYKYIKTKRDNTKYKLHEMARELCYSITSIKRIDISAVDKIAYMKYKEEAIEIEKLEKVG